MSNYSDDLWDCFPIIVKRFDDGFATTNTVGKLASTLGDMHKGNAKVLSKVRFKAEDSGGMDNYYQAMDDYHSSIGDEKNSLEVELKTLISEINDRSKQVKKDFSGEQKLEAKAVKEWAKANDDLLNCKKKDLDDGLKWNRSRQNLIATEQSYTPNEKAIKKQVKKEKKLRDGSIKSRDKYQKFVGEHAKKLEEYFAKIKQILTDTEKIDIQFVDYQKAHLVKLFNVLQNHYQKALDHTQKLKETIDGINPQELIAQFVENTKSGKQPEVNKFDPYVKDKAEYDPRFKVGKEKEDQKESVEVEKEDEEQGEEEQEENEKDEEEDYENQGEEGGDFD